MNSLQNRRYAILGLILFIIITFAVKLFTLQITNDKWSARATSLTENELVIQPSRGEIYDRNGRILVANTPIYDIRVIPERIQNLDTLRLLELLEIKKEALDKVLDRARSRREMFNPHTVAKHVDQEDYFNISEELSDFPGFFAVRRTLRNYPDSAAALVLGNFGEINRNELNADSGSFYQLGDYVGKGGLEKSYEKLLRGVKGKQAIYVNNFNKVVGKANSTDNIEPLAGNDLISTIDAELQAFGEKLMVNKRGSIIAIEPSTGEILALISAPTYDPNSLVGRKRSAGYSKLSQDTLKPLFNRALNGLYRPGSIFKMIQSLIALEEGIITPKTRVRCNRGIIGCHGPHTNDDLENAIKHSCNPYFRQVMRKMVQQGKHDNQFSDLKSGVQWWHERIKRFGLHTRFTSDVPNIKRGTVPDTSFYNRFYPNSTWTYSMIYSISIGEGELQVNPLQMANLAAIIANKGWYITPHLLKEVIGGPELPPDFTEKQGVGVKPKHFEVVRNAMERVINEPGGTAVSANLSHLGITVCGKTGTVQNKSPIEDHSVFMCFAPKEDPKIAVAVYVENAGFGGTWAAPISALMIEKYLTREISNDFTVKRILEADFRGLHGK
ncbi:MAG: penicillin-binding protein 2 [Flavobacteriales bacterium]